LIAQLPSEAIEAGTLLDERHYDTIVSDEDTEVFKPDGSLLLRYIKRAVPENLYAPARAALHSAASGTFNRGLAAGIITDHEKQLAGRIPHGYVKTSTNRIRRIKADGSVSTTTEAIPVFSGIAGYFDRTARRPFCRQTRFNAAEADHFEQAKPFIRRVNDLFRQHVPDRHAAQARMAERTSPEFVIDGTVFTTLTVNLNWRTAVHQDAGDLREGFGVMCAIAHGFEGGFTVWPQFRVGCDLQSGDIVFADVHEWHANTPIRPVARWQRLSCIFYYRERMIQCGSAQEELDRAKRKTLAGRT
jgi:hypothetical protein